MKGTKGEWGNAKHNRFKLLRTNTAAIITAQEKDSIILNCVKQHRSMWAFTWEFDRWPAETAKLVAVNFFLNFPFN